jgi:hypothetical protein
MKVIMVILQGWRREQADRRTEQQRPCFAVRFGRKLRTKSGP